MTPHALRLGGAKATCSARGEDYREDATAYCRIEKLLTKVASAWPFASAVDFATVSIQYVGVAGMRPMLPMPNICAAVSRSIHRSRSIANTRPDSVNCPEDTLTRVIDGRYCILASAEVAGRPGDLDVLLVRCIAISLQR